MRLKISHTTEYGYASLMPYALQRVRLLPRSGPTQNVLSWVIDFEGAREEVRFNDQFNNDTRLLSASGAARSIAIRASGEIDTKDTGGVSGPHTGFAPLWLFTSETALTAAGKQVNALARSVKQSDEIERLHALMQAIGERVAYLIGSTDAETNAETALEQKQGVCQDHAHIFIAAARLLGFPARYVSGYLLLDDRVDQVASHAWAEAYVEGLGWVSFDPSNGMCPDERYVRLAIGRDYRDAMPTSGILLGHAIERLDVRITVEQMGSGNGQQQNQ
ncbi:MAG TPA: transglutaminase family protein [Mesorhizobium sp.]|jgi:transglutaminase-like putative cysteine protease